MSTTQEIIELFNERKRSTMKATPFSLFFLHKGKSLTKALFEEIRRKPQVNELIKRIKHEWKILPDSDKIIYLKAAIELGFEAKKLFVDNTQMRKKIEDRIKAVKSRLSRLNT